MAKPDDASAKLSTVKVSDLDQARVRVTSDNRLQVEFKIQDLIRKLVPGGAVASHCGGCTGCTGCGN